MTKVLTLLGAAISFYLAYITGTGEILNYIHFADPLNEMGFFVLAIMMGTGLLMCSKSESKC
tara:strand:- start:455 stop:640 length:186 start_codon:yes stop_codon:yes gene_type:complete